MQHNALTASSQSYADQDSQKASKKSDHSILLLATQPLTASTEACSPSQGYG